MGTVNRVPQGFLGTLDAKTLGRTPAEVLPDVRPVMAMDDYYLADIDLTIGTETETGITTIGQHAELSVPDGELWFVYMVEANYSPSAGGGQCFFAPRIVTRENNVLNGDFVVVTLGVGNTWSTVMKLNDSPLLCKSGVQFATVFGGISGTNIVTTRVLKRSVRI